jgi:transcriptional regulator with XRE-family HTH domain
MDMQIDASKVRAGREQRAWSQEQLAEVAGLSLRTIQRVETSGSASFETTKAIAAVFEADIASLLLPVAVPVEAPPSAFRLAPRWRYLGLAASALLSLGVVLMGDARAGEVMLDVVLKRNSVELGQHQLVANEGKSAEIRHDGEVRVFVNPVVTQDGSILLSMRVEEPSGTRWVEIGEPRIMVVNGNEAQVKVTSPKGSVYHIVIRPRRM